MTALEFMRRVPVPGPTVVVTPSEREWSRETCERLQRR